MPGDEAKQLVQLCANQLSSTGGNSPNIPLEARTQSFAAPTPLFVAFWML
jgi:hypothetical protein